MAATAYATVPELAARLDIGNQTQDTILAQLLDAASRQIDGWCNRTFASGPEARQLTADTCDLLVLPEDLHALTAIAIDRDGDRVYETAWTLTDVDLQPYPGPYQVIRPRDRAFPTHRYAIQVTGDWGYGTEIPVPIREATLLQAARLYKRKDAPFGIAGTADHGELMTISAMDPDIKELLKPYERHWMVV